MKLLRDEDIKIALRGFYPRYPINPLFFLFLLLPLRAVEERTTAIL